MRYSGALWRGDVPNRTPSGMSRHMGVTLHIMQGTLSGTDSWFKNPKSEASSHFGVGLKGQKYQWVDTADKAWAQGGGNPSWISIELEGKSGDAMTREQVQSVAEIYAWCVQAHGVPVHTTDRPAMGGLGWHGMGGSAWGNHPHCPGSRIVGQRSEVLSVVHTLLTPAEKVRPMFTPAVAMEPIVAELACPTGGVWLLAGSGAVYAWGGAPYRGGAHGQSYFKGKKAARLELVTDNPDYMYRIISTDGGKYGY